jgi:hypothetical protein
MRSLQRIASSSSGRFLLRNQNQFTMNGILGSTFIVRDSLNLFIGLRNLPHLRKNFATSILRRSEWATSPPDIRTCLQCGRVHCSTDRSTAFQTATKCASRNSENGEKAICGPTDLYHMTYRGCFRFRLQKKLHPDQKEYGFQIQD